MRGKTEDFGDRHRRRGARLCLLSLVVILLSCARATPQPTAPLAPGLTATVPPRLIRAPAVAGQFYPAEPQALTTMVDEMLNRVSDKVEASPIALIVPHAGYIYSGQVAAYAFKQLEGRDIQTAVIIGPNHTRPDFDQVSVYPEGAFRTPLGLVLVDRELAHELIAADERIVSRPDVHRSEHSIEVELPFLQRVCPRCRIVPVIMGTPSPENCRALAHALAKALPGRQAVIIASSDLSHYPSYDDAVEVDHATLSAIETLDPERFRQSIEEQMSRGIPGLATCACGEGPILVAMMAARELGANRAKVLRYANSGDTPFGGHDRVVGYGAVMFWQGESPSLNPAPTPPPRVQSTWPPPLGREEKAKLLDIARESIALYLKAGFAPLYQVSETGLLQKCGAFVTLKKHGQLRGCIGYTVPLFPLYQTVQRAALAAALQDPRFPPLSPDELDEIEVEISVLSPLEKLEDVRQIQVGKHGLVIVKGRASGLLLPQVAVEEGWDREEFLRAVCRKAGLPEDAWKEGAELYVFTAEVFDERSYAIREAGE